MTPAAYIDRHPEALLRRLRHLVGIPTVNPPGENYDRITAWLTRELRAVGLAAERHPVPAALARRTLPPEQHAFPRFNVLGRRAARGARRTVHFNAHYDVVPVSGSWRHGDPFSGREERGWVYGRGTADMKGSIASLLLALEDPRTGLEVLAAAISVGQVVDQVIQPRLMGSIVGLQPAWLLVCLPIGARVGSLMGLGDLLGLLLAVPVASCLKTFFDAWAEHRGLAQVNDGAG